MKVNQLTLIGRQPAQAGRANAKMRLTNVITTILLAALLTACSRKASLNSVLDSKAFDSAPADVQSTWRAAVSDLQTNGYAPAYVELFKLQSMDNDLAPEQRGAVESAITTVSAKVFDAAGRGDPAALNAMEEIRQLRSDRAAGAKR
jgi:hypothetical protein